MTRAPPRRASSWRFTAEALQAGPDTYAHIGWLAAVPAHALVTLTGDLLAPATERLSHLLSYLADANQHVTALHARDHLGVEGAGCGD